MKRRTRHPTPICAPSGAGSLHPRCSTSKGGLAFLQAEVKRILATLLFTDIVGSTEHARRLGDGESTARQPQHHNAARAEIARCEGIGVDTAGDGFAD
jgi:class 3 adenylate cyclase